MAFIGQQLDTLLNLGLSPNEAKVYLGALKTGKATVKTIAKSASIGREDVYRILPSLHELGLVKKHLESPAKYEATSPIEAMKILFACRDKENEQLKSQANEFLRLFSNGENTRDVVDEKTVLVSRDNCSGVDPELIRLARKTNHSFDFTTRQKLFFTAFNEPGLTGWIDEMYYAAERGVKFRIIIDSPKNFEPWPKVNFSISNSNLFLQHSNVNIRFVSTPPECLIILFDNQACCIETSCQKETKMSPYLITNNPVFAALGKTYFELLWSHGFTKEQMRKANLTLIKKRKAKTRIKSQCRFQKRSSRPNQTTPSLNHTLSSV